MKTYLVTGGCGFIGSHLCRALVSRGDAIRVLDDLSTGFAANLPASASLIEGDVADPTTVRRALAGTAGCFHLAAIASVELSRRDWLGTHRTNLGGAITVFDAAAAAAIPVVYASSAAVYGDCVRLPIDEGADKEPISAYGADKLGCELHARAGARTRRLSSVGLRLFNVYGPGQNPKSPYSGVISIFCDRIRHGQPIEFFGDGRQSRDFVFVGDVIAVMLGAMDAPPTGAPVFNVCTGRATSVRELAQLIGRLSGRVPEIRLRPGRDGEIEHSRGDPTAARRAFGLGEPTDLTTGLAQTLASLDEARGRTTTRSPSPTTTLSRRGKRRPAAQLS
jgi:UDP-glucose 4-epimerase